MDELNIAITSNSRIQQSAKCDESSFISLSVWLHHARLKSNVNRGSHKSKMSRRNIISGDSDVTITWKLKQKE